MFSQLWKYSIGDEIQNDCLLSVTGTWGSDEPRIRLVVSDGIDFLF